jgi:tRNA(Arg) A34 adenosine deaminase TadA
VSATAAWQVLDEGWTAALDEAWQSWCDGSAGVGASITDANGVVIARGRNRRHDTRDGDGLAGSRVAHAEMCALAALPDGSFDGRTLSTTFEPCLMCAGAIILCAVPRVRYAAADPVWDGMHDWFTSLPQAAKRRPERELLGGPIGAFAHVLHLSWLALWIPDSDAVALHDRLVPRHLELARDVVESSDLPAIATDRGSVTDALDALWPDLLALS